MEWERKKRVVSFGKEIYESYVAVRLFCLQEKEK